MLKVALVGTGGMLPLQNRYLSSMLISCEGSNILVDCGEGTQVALRNIGWGFKNIDIICITHFHGDHVLGLPGLLSTIGNCGRVEPLILIGPKQLMLVVQSLCCVVGELPFPLKFIEVEENENLEYVYKKYNIKAQWIEHSMPCLGFSFEVKRTGKFHRDKAVSNNVPMVIWGQLQKKEEVEYEGALYTKDMVLGEERKGIKVAYCTDTRPCENIIKLGSNSDLLICEGMYGEDALKEKAIAKQHMTFSEAGTMAKECNAKELWLTHYSPSLVNPNEYIEDIRRVFENSHIGYDGMWKEFIFEA